MTTILVERTFAEPQVFEDVQSQEEARAWCLEMHDVTFSHTYFRADRRRMVCVYSAPDAESVRLAQRKADLPFDRAWRAADFSLITATSHASLTQLVVVERTYPAAPVAEQVTHMRASTAWCFETNDIQPISMYFEAGGVRGVCAYIAPDLESVRRANRLAQLPIDDIWSAELRIIDK